MAIYNEILAGRFARALQKIFSMKGTNPSKQLSGEMMPVHPFLTGVENRFSESWDRFGTAVNITGGAGQFTGLRFRNPVGSGSIAIVEKCVVTTAAADRVNFDIGPTSLDLAGGVASRSMDPRGRAGSVLILTDQTTLGVNITPSLFLYPTQANVAFELCLHEDQEIPILPGIALTIGGTSAAQQIQFAVLWRERPLEESERQ